MAIYGLLMDVVGMLKDVVEMLLRLDTLFSFVFCIHFRNVDRMLMVC